MYYEKSLDTELIVCYYLDIETKSSGLKARREETKMTTTTTETAGTMNRLELICDPSQSVPIVRIDLGEGGTFYATTEFKSNNWRTFHQAHGHELEFTLHGNINAAYFADWFNETAKPIVDRIVAGYESEWNGSNNVAVLTEDAEEAKTELSELFEESISEPAYPTLGEYAGWWDASEWINEGASDICRDYNINAETTDAEAASIAIQIEADMATPNDVVLSNTLGWINYQVESMKSDTEDAE